MAAFDPRTPFSLAEARAAGISRSTLAGPCYRRLFTDVYVSAAVRPGVPVLARGALRRAPAGSGLTHHTAALLWGGVVPHSPSVHVGMGAVHRLEVAGVTAHRYRDLPRWTRRGGLPVTGPEQTFLDLAASLDLVDLLVLGDSLVRRGVTTCRALVDAAATHTGRGARLARRAAALVRVGVDSAMESRLRLLIVLAGLPEPVLQHEVRWTDGTLRYRLDLSYPGARVAIEYDGRHHIEREGQWQRDLGRREQLEGEGWRFVVVVSTDVHATPERTLQRIEAALRGAGLPVRVRSDEWRRHFPGRAAA